jgi:hypothetical protein
MFCRSLFVLWQLFFWPFCGLFFFDIQILTTLWYPQILSKFKGQSLIKMTSGTMRFCHCFVCHPSIVLSVIFPLSFLSFFHMWLSITLLVCSRISQKSAHLWQHNIEQWRSSTQLISTTRVSPSLNSLNTKTTTIYDVDNPMQQALHVAGIHQLMGIMGSQAWHLENLSHYCPNIIQNLTQKFFKRWNL